MPTIKYACSICGEVFADEAKAADCEARGLAELPIVGTVFRYYDSNHSSRILAVQCAKNIGHKAQVTYISQTGPGATVKDGRMWGVGYKDNDELWKVIQQMSRYRVTPRIMFGETFSEEPVKFLQIEEMFK